MTTTTKGTTMTTPESPAAPVFAPHSPATGAQVPTEPGNGTGTQADFGVTWPSTIHDGCNYAAYRPRDHSGLFCNKCGWSWSATAARLDAALAELAALKARRCDGCQHYTPPNRYDTTIEISDDGDVSETTDKHGRCVLGASGDGRPLTPDSPMYAHGSEWYAAALRVLPNHTCNEWTPTTTDQENA